MSEFKGTQGEWMLVFDSDGGFEIAAYNSHGAYMSLASRGRHSQRIGEMRANARIMWASKDLLEALQMLHDETADYITLNKLGDPHHNRSMQLARAAIRKALGEDE